MSSGDSLISEALAIVSGFKVAGVNKEKKEKLLSILTQMRKETDEVQIQSGKLKCEAEKWLQRCVDLEKKLLDAQKVAEAEVAKRQLLHSQSQLDVKALRRELAAKVGELQLEIPDCTIGEDLSSLLDSSRLSDVTVNVKGKDFHLHQNILAARSPVFRAMFDHDMLESCQRHVDIPDISVDVMKDLVRFIYTGVAPNLQSLAPELLAAADKYGLTRLKLQCEAHLSTNLSATNVCELLVVADLHDSSYLRKEALHYLVNNANQVMTTAGYRSMETSHPQLVSEAFRLLASLNAKGSDGDTPSAAKRVKLSD